MWNAARERVRKSGRVWREPRVKAAIELTKHGASEERPDLREAYENLAARSMTEDEWEHDYEEYARWLSKLQSGDIAILRSINEKTTPTLEEKRDGHLRFLEMPDLIKSTGNTMTRDMEVVDRLEANGLLIVRSGVRIHEMGERQPGNWSIPEHTGIHLKYFSVFPNPRGIALIEHIANLKPRDHPDDT